MSHVYRSFSCEFAVNKDPKTAALLSLIPGLGQYYNGQSRKGLLFLDVAIVNYFLLGLILLAPQISDGLKKLGAAFSMEINQTLVSLLHSIRFGTPASMVVLGLALTFIAYAVRDAYDQAMLKRRKAIYKDAIIELNEAASGSYILHASSIVGLAVMAVFFFVPHQTARQIIEIEILPSLTKTPPKQETRTHSTPATAMRNLDPRREINKDPRHAQVSKNEQISKSHAADSSPSKSSTSEKPISPAPRADLKNLIAKAFTPPAPPVPAKTQTSASLTPPTQLSKVQTSSLPSAKSPTSQLSPPMPKLNLTRAVVASAPLPPAPMSPSSAVATAAKLPLLVAINPTNLSPAAVNATLPSSPSAVTAQANLPQMADSASLKNGRGASAMPTGATASRNSAGFQLPGMAANLGAPAAIGKSSSPLLPGSQGSRMGGVPSSIGPVIDSADSSGQRGAQGTQPVTMPVEGSGRDGNRGAGEKGRSPAPMRADGKDRAGVPGLVPQVGPGAARPNFKEGENGPSNIKSAAPAEVDFSLYMEKLQRKIKQAWIPARDHSSRKVKVRFNIFTSGELGRVQLIQGSGVALADQAALQAVANAAPFAHLPEGAPPSIDVEFTFDYNVFQGSIR